jgi:hypothetical protein
MCVVADAEGGWRQFGRGLGLAFARDAPWPYLHFLQARTALCERTIAHFCATSPLFAILTHCMGGGSMNLSNHTRPNSLCASMSELAPARSGWLIPSTASRFTLETYVPPGASLIIEAGAQATASGTLYESLTHPCRFSSVPCPFCRRAASRSHVRAIDGSPLRNPRSPHR